MTEESAGYCQITLDAKLASRAAPDLFARLGEHRSDTVVLDASKVEQIGVLCMQILTSAARSWQQAGRGFEVIDPSEAFRSSAADVGLDLALMGVEGVGESFGAA